MKRILFLLIAIIGLTVNSFAQEATTYDKYVGYTESWFSYFPLSTDRVHTATDSIWYYTCLKESYWPVKYDMKVKLHKVSGTTRVVPVILKAKKFDSDAWTTVTTVYWVTGADTTKTFTQSSTYQQYRYWQIYMKANLKGMVSTVPELSMKFWD